MNTNYIQGKLCDVMTSFYEAMWTVPLRIFPGKGRQKSFMTASLAGDE